MKLQELLKANGFDEYPEQLMALGFAKDVLYNGTVLREVEEVINQILTETGEDFNFDEEKARW